MEVFFSFVTDNVEEQLKKTTLHRSELYQHFLDNSDFRNLEAGLIALFYHLVRLQYQTKLDQNALLCQKWEVGGSLREIKKLKVFKMDFTWWFADTVLSIRSRDIVAEFKLSGFVDTTKLRIYCKSLIIQSSDNSMQKFAFMTLVECCIKVSYHPRHVLVFTVCFFIHSLTLWWSSMTRF